MQYRRCSVAAETQQEVRMLADVLRMAEKARTLRAAYKRIDFSVGHPSPRLLEDMTNTCAVAVGRRYRDS